MYEKIIYFCFFLFSLYSYINAPVRFSPSYCLTQFYVYLSTMVFSIWMNKKRYGTFFNSTTIFLVLFLLSTHLHSIYYYNEESLLPSFAFGYNQRIVNSAICVAQLGISSYLLGTSFVPSQKTEMVANISWVNSKICAFFQRVSVFVSLGWFFYVFFLLRKSSTYVIVYPRLTLLLTSILIYALLLTVLDDYNKKRLNLKNTILRNRLFFSSFIIFLLPYFYLNSRTNPAAIALIILMLVHFFYVRISARIFALFGFASVVLMAIVSYSRLSDINTGTAGFFTVLSYGIDFLLSNEHATTFLFQDYMLNIRNLYDGVDYPMHNGYLYGITYFPILFSIIPFLPNFLVELMGYKLEDIDTSKLLTLYNNSDYGLGTHIVGDLYINGGIFFVIIGMFLLGYIITKSEYRNTFIMFILSCSIYGSIMMLPRICFIAWFPMFSMLLLMYFISKYVLKY